MVSHVVQNTFKKKLFLQEGIVWVDSLANFAHKFTIYNYFNCLKKVFNSFYYNLFSNESGKLIVWGTQYSLSSNAKTGI
jgi:hypothetical protein